MTVLYTLIISPILLWDHNQNQSYRIECGNLYNPIIAMIKSRQDFPTALKYKHYILAMKFPNSFPKNEQQMAMYSTALSGEPEIQEIDGEFDGVVERAGIGGGLRDCGISEVRDRSRGRGQDRKSHSEVRQFTSFIKQISQPQTQQKPQPIDPITEQKQSNKSSNKSISYNENLSISSHQKGVSRSQEYSVEGLAVTELQRSQFGFVKEMKKQGKGGRRENLLTDGDGMGVAKKVNLAEDSSDEEEEARIIEMGIKSRGVKNLNVSSRTLNISLSKTSSDKDNSISILLQPQKAKSTQTLPAAQPQSPQKQISQAQPPITKQESPPFVLVSDHNFQTSNEDKSKMDEDMEKNQVESPQSEISYGSSKKEEEGAGLGGGGGLGEPMDEMERKQEEEVRRMQHVLYFATSPIENVQGQQFGGDQMDVEVGGWASQGQKEKEQGCELTGDNELVVRFLNDYRQKTGRDWLSQPKINPLKQKPLPPPQTTHTESQTQPPQPPLTHQILHKLSTLEHTILTLTDKYSQSLTTIEALAHQMERQQRSIGLLYQQAKGQAEVCQGLGAGLGEVRGGLERVVGKVGEVQGCVDRDCKEMEVKIAKVQMQLTSQIMRLGSAIFEQMNNNKNKSRAP